ncbi:MAG: rRNA maturation RNase YbeY [Armatimonadetes bacterium]|nr:rRNA maturation RNase YbeY [Armatimonadota bacterium]
MKTLLAHENARFGDVSVLVTTDEEIRGLNHNWRQLDETTDVLSWPAPDLPGMGIGDIAISFPMAEKQAKARGAAVADEICLLAIHGGLHLLGYDDLTEPDHAEMMRKMGTIARLAEIPMDQEWASLPHGGDA